MAIRIFIADDHPIVRQGLRRIVEADAGMLDLITAGRLHPEKLLGKTITLSQVGPELARMGSFLGVGVTIAVLD